MPSDDFIYLADFAAKQMLATIKAEREGAAMNLTMIVESKVETKHGVTFELRRTRESPYYDDRFTIIIMEGEEVPPWKIGHRVDIAVTRTSAPVTPKDNVNG